MQRNLWVIFVSIAAVLALFPEGCGQEGRRVTSGDLENILPLWEQARLMEKQLRWRQENGVPEVMRRYGIDLWIVGKNEGVLYLSLVPGNIEGLVRGEPDFLVFIDRGEKRGVERAASDLSGLPSLIEGVKPAHIGVSESHLAVMGNILPAPWDDRLEDSRRLRIGFLEKRTPEEIGVFYHVARIAHAIIAEAFSNRAVIPDVTTTDELNWWIRQRYRDLGLLTSDHPTITLQRCSVERIKYAEPDEHFRIDLPPRNGYNSVIRRGDIIACDTGIDYLGLGTDTQQVGYVLRTGESDVPGGLREAMARTNKLQDIFAAEFEEGRSGNDIWLSALKKAKAAGLRPSIYSHPIPYFLMRYEVNGAFFKNTRYGAGPDLGDGESEAPTERGEYPVCLETVYAMELDTKTSIPEWGGQDVRIVLEQTVAFTAKGIEYLGGRQTKWHIIR